MVGEGNKGLLKEGVGVIDIEDGYRKTEKHRSGYRWGWKEMDGEWELE